LVLSADIQAEVLVRHFREKQGLRRIARELHLTRKTVRSIIERRQVLLVRRAPVRASILEPFKDQVKELMGRDPGISIRTLMQHIRGKGYSGGYTILRDWVTTQRENARRPKEAFLSLEFSAGECAQVDWGEFGDVFKDGCKIHCFVMVLCYSRLLYIEFTRSEKFEQFISCHENAFRFFGGVPKECWYDNLATAVTDRMGPIVRFNAKFFAYIGHHGIRPHACNVARGNEKGRVEDGVKYIRGSFWAGRVFRDFDDLTQQAALWRDEIANRREHRTTRKIPILHFEADEKAALSRLNPHPYDTDEVFSRVVPPSYHIHYDTNRYSVPWTLVGVSITIRVNDRAIQIFYNEKFVTRHERSYRKFQKVTTPDHEKGLLERKPGASRESSQIESLKGLGPAMAEYLRLLRSGTRSIRTEVARLLALSTVYGPTDLHDATRELLKSGIVGVDNLELLLRSRHEPQNPEPLSFLNQRLNRVVPQVDLRRYDALLFENGPKNQEKESGDTN
jgi:transposase